MKLFSLFIAVLLHFRGFKLHWTPAHTWSKKIITWYGEVSVPLAGHPSVRFACLIVPAMLLTWLAAGYSDKWYMELVTLVVSILLLCFALGYRELEQDMAPFKEHWRIQSWEAAFEHGATVLDYGKLDCPKELIRQTMTIYLVRMNQTLFAPLFWFAVFGAAGVVMYLLAVAADEYDQDTGANGEGGVPDDPPLAGWISCGAEFRRILDAIPARVVAATLGLLELDNRLFSLSVRRFEGQEDVAVMVLREAAGDSVEFETLPDDEDLLASEGLKRLDSLMDLRANVFWCWVIVIAIGTTMGWMF